MRWRVSFPLGPSLLGWFVEPEEVAALIAHVASPLSSATNGSSLRVDGGGVRSIV